MAIQEILIYPKHKVDLRRKCAQVSDVNLQVKRLVGDLKDTLAHHSDGIGLAAPQINVHQRVVIVRLNGGVKGVSQSKPPIAMINPRILEASDERRDFDGCLSFPDLYGETIRPHYLRVIYLDEEGQRTGGVFHEFDAVVVHHEIDHLDGVLFIDRIEYKEDLYRVKENDSGELVRVPVLWFEEGSRLR